jgi:hypothetical protein
VGAQVVEDRTLLQSQKAKVGDLLTTAGLSPHSFEWQRVNSGSSDVSRLEHVDTKFFYLFDYRWDGQDEVSTDVAFYSPGNTSRTETAWLREWDEHAEQVLAWIRNLKRELEAVDYWSPTEPLAAALREIERNEPFNREEQVLIAEQLGEIRGRIDEIKELTQAQARLADTRFEYLRTATRRLGRFDWTNLVVSQLVTIAWEIGYNPGQARQLYEFFAAALSGVVQGLPQLPR